MRRLRLPLPHFLLLPTFPLTCYFFASGEGGIGSRSEWVCRDVVMNATIGVDGYVTDVQVVGSPQADLANAANCTPVDVQMRVTITFKPLL